MLDINKSMFIETLPVNVHSSVIAIEEGTPLVYEMENGLGKVKPATGAENEVYAGVSVSRATTPTIAPKTETLMVPASGPYTVNLSKTPAGTVGVVAIAANGTRTVLAAAGAASGTEFARSGKVLTLTAAFAGQALKVTYTYTLSHQEAVLSFNFDAFASVDLAVVPVVGVVWSGIVYTSMYDPTVDWDAFANGSGLKLGDGVYTIGGSGTTIQGFVSEAPSANSKGFLGIRFVG